MQVSVSRDCRRGSKHSGMAAPPMEIFTKKPFKSQWNGDFPYFHQMNEMHIRYLLFKCGYVLLEPVLLFVLGFDYGFEYASVGL
jgi:hypothetical protein